MDEQWKKFLLPPPITGGCTTWTGPYKRRLRPASPTAQSHEEDPSSAPHTRSAGYPIYRFARNASTNARFLVAAAHKLVPSVDTLKSRDAQLSMTCGNPYCVASHHMKVHYAMRPPKFRPTHRISRVHTPTTPMEGGLKRSYSTHSSDTSMVSSCEDEYDEDDTVSMSDAECPLPTSPQKRLRIMESTKDLSPSTTCQISLAE